MLVGTVFALAVTDCEKHINRLIRSEITLRIATTSTRWERQNFPFCNGSEIEPLTVTGILKIFRQIYNFCRICQIYCFAFVNIARDRK